MEFGTSCGAVKFMFVHVIAKEKIRERVGLVYLAMLLRCVRLTCKHYLVQKSWKIKMFRRANSIQRFNKE